MVHGDRSRHAARGAETIGGGCWVEGGGEFEVYNVPHQERMWGVGYIKMKVRQR